MSSHNDIEQVAAQWINRAQSSQWTAQDQRQLDAWLGQDTAHRVAWLRLKSVWDRADRLAAVRGVQSPRTRRWASPVRWSAAAAVAMLAVLLNMPWWGPGTRYTTEVGGREVMALSDGSRVELNTHTELRAQVDPSLRHVWLDKGEAFFDVKPDPAHPFVIHAGDHKVVVLGTKFSVRQERERLEVAVLEGKVRVEPMVAKPGRPPVIVQGGGLLYSKPAGTLVAVNAQDKVRRSLSWRHGTLEFDQSTLADVAAQFNRYNEKQLVLMDTETAHMRVGGSFDAVGVDAFARLLATGFNLRVETHGDQIRVSQPH
ncbi:MULTISPECIES: FecR family protein [Stenotrophomonas]|uniref:FecR domain-containing protein n=1 Tax=Stenotrophomonas muris TaxID=2963283 RepID=A0ABU5MG80_9GAMM|nr:MULTISPECIES: FecR domain-containing protein [Stenotrophomonas]EKT4102244.1 FecR domain-containing protein [Stenotrophomonas maltophilia]EMB2829514.1 FecR domain-containing protein [Stenotrophomonas maltophilia]MBH1450871.1 FecR domain-containing protein [Stenotrophomonas maltophilia]MBH1458304.1 FecR domain-containing protein [Stenotrophomonas maltophilia]MBH1492138.1 FecR domain-containing protein [Stenotrophomonas maltophilia]